MSVSANGVKAGSDEGGGGHAYGVPVGIEIRMWVGPGLGLKYGQGWLLLESGKS